MVLGSEEPRVFTPPLRELTPETSLGFAFADFCEQVCKIPLLPWERWLGIHALELTECGGLRFRTVIVLIGRQNGKTTFGKLLTLFFLYVLGVPLVVGTAQTLDLAEEVWDAAVALAEETDELSGEIRKVSRRNGGKALILSGGRRYLIKASSRRGGRGISADLVLMDELREHTNFDAWSAISKTTNARPDGLVWCMSNAGDSESVVLRHLRTQAHAALGDPDGVAEAIGELIAAPEDGDEVDEDTLALFEWSAPPNCDKWDRGAWAAANPSLGHGFMTERAIASACRTDPDDVFRTEVLCQWADSTIVGKFPEGAWESALDPESEIPEDGELYFGIDMDIDRTMTTVAVCGLRADGGWHVEIVARAGGFGWALEFLERQVAAHGVARVALQGRGATVSSRIDELRAIKGLDVTLCEGAMLGAWCGRFYDSVMSCSSKDSDATSLRHREQPILDDAAKVAQARSLGDGAWAWDRRGSNRDISPLVAATMAFGLASAVGERPRESAYEDHDLLFF